MAFSIHPAVGNLFFMDEMRGRILLFHAHRGAVKSDGHEGSMGGFCQMGDGAAGGWLDGEGMTKNGIKHGFFKKNALIVIAIRWRLQPGNLPVSY